MPLVRKVITVGRARAITLPAEWLEWIRRESGKEPREVLIEVDGELKIKPKLE